MRKETIYEYFQKEGLRKESLFNEELIATINLLFKPVKYGTLNELEFENKYCWTVLDDILHGLVIPRKENDSFFENAYLFIDEDGERYCVLSLWSPNKKESVDSVRCQLDDVLEGAYKKASEEYTPHFLSKVLVLEEGLYEKESTIGVGIPSILLYYYMLDLLEQVYDEVECELFERIKLLNGGKELVGEYSNLLTKLNLIKLYLEE